MKVLCVIPSRLASVRLPRKALLPVQGVPMVLKVYRCAKSCPMIDRVVVATDSEEIATVVREGGGEAIMTDAQLATGSDRVAAAAAQFPEMDIIVNLQGDEPFMQPAMLEQLVAPFWQDKTAKLKMSTLACPLAATDYALPDVVKVLVDRSGHAIYFSRARIPFLRSKEIPLAMLPVYHHIGVYAFEANFLQQYCRWPAGPLECAELLEQLRVLEHGYAIKVCLVAGPTLEINTPADYAKAQQFNCGESKVG